ncbi:MAG: dipeptide/oligopeptide/nickel ABC transporter ATP-binding protein [Methanolinea sp.]|nr:dipeptide/oligopeptide/nickel ABC transporter ATP-binding protein [Methanolinea sp.]
MSFSLGSGETIGLFGLSGSGKSTLGRCILGLERPTEGRVYVEGREVVAGRVPRGTIPPIQMIFQHPEVSFDPRKRLLVSVTEPLVYHTRRAQEEVFESLMPLIQAVGLKREHFMRYPHQLSGGEIQRAMLVRIYSLKPRIVIADEPTSMLDMSVQAQVLSLMKTLQGRNGNACIFISHDPDVIQAMCERVGVLNGGRFQLMEMDAFAREVGRISAREQKSFPHCPPEPELSP